MRKTSEVIKTEEELDARLSDLQAEKLRTQQRHARFVYYRDISTLVIAIVLALTYVIPAVTPERALEQLPYEIFISLGAARGILTLLLILTALRHSINGIIWYRRGL